MEILTVLLDFFDFLSTEKSALIFTSISHFLLLAGLIYSVFHLIKLMIDPAEEDVYEEPIAPIEKLIS